MKIMRIIITSSLFLMSCGQKTPEAYHQVLTTSPDGHYSAFVTPSLHHSDSRKEGKVQYSLSVREIGADKEKEALFYDQLVFIDRQGADVEGRHSRVVWSEDSSEVLFEFSGTSVVVNVAILWEEAGGSVPRVLVYDGKRLP